MLQVFFRQFFCFLISCVCHRPQGVRCQCQVGSCLPMLLLFFHQFPCPFMSCVFHRLQVSFGPIMVFLFVRKVLLLFIPKLCHFIQFCCDVDIFVLFVGVQDPQGVSLLRHLLQLSQSLLVRVLFRF